MTTPETEAARWAEVRRRTKLSRQAFAQRVGLTPGAVWRIETRGVYKPGELEKLEAALHEVVTTVGAVTPKILPTAQTPAQHPAPASTPVPTAPPVSHVLEVPWYAEEDVQWLDAAPQPPPQLTPSPTALAAADGIPRYSNSELGTFEDCERRWWLTFYRGLGPREESPIGVREIGNRVHRALESYYVAHPLQSQDPRDALEEILAGDWQGIELRHQLRNLEVSAELRSEFQREADLQRAMVAGYLQWVQETGADSDLRVVEPEAYLEADLPEVGSKIVAKLDVRVIRGSDEARMWLEHKTVGSIQQKLRTVSMDEQVLHQTLVESLHGREHGAPRVAGVIYNLIRRVKRGVQAKPPFFQRVEVHHNPHELDSFQRRTVLRIERVQRARKLLDAGVVHTDVVTARPSGDCSWKCPFVQICPMLDDGSRAEAALERYFRPGDPYEYYVKEK